MWLIQQDVYHFQLVITLININTLKCYLWLIHSRCWVPAFRTYITVVSLTNQLAWVAMDGDPFDHVNNLIQTTVKLEVNEWSIQPLNLQLSPICVYIRHPNVLAGNALLKR